MKWVRVLHSNIYSLCRIPSFYLLPRIITLKVAQLHCVQRIINNLRLVAQASTPSLNCQCSMSVSVPDGTETYISVLIVVGVQTQNHRECQILLKKKKAVRIEPMLSKSRGMLGDHCASTLALKQQLQALTKLLIQTQKRSKFGKRVEIVLVEWFLFLWSHLFPATNVVIARKIMTGFCSYDLPDS